MSLERIGKYRVVAKIGEGAMGEVYKAHDPLLNRFVALKTISQGLSSDPQFRERFIREAQSAASLNHPNIITVYDFGEESGLTYMAMEFLDGTDLREAIRSRSLSHLGRKIEVMEQLCDGVGFAHARGIVHRDLKPGNIHVLPSGHVKVLDFGLARLGASDMTKTGTVMGTPHYMAPEQLRGQKADARADVFALGAIFYELLSGVRAFEGQAIHEVMQRMRDRDPEPLRKRAPATPLALAAVVDRALSRAPEARFKDASEMGRALARTRDEFAGETLAAPGTRDDAAERTILQAAGETLLEPRRVPGVAGTSALDVRRHHGETQRTVRPDPTVGPGPATEVGRRRLPLVLGAAVLAVGVAAVGLWLRGRGAAPASVEAPAAASQDELGMITDVVVSGKLDLARADLDNKDYAAAAASAREALSFDPQNADAQRLLAEADGKQRELAAAVAEARAAVSRGDTQQGSAALSRVLELDPRNPVVAELSPRLNQSFRKEAEDARRLAATARTGADRARASGVPEYAAARSLTSEADAAFRRGEFTVAAQKFLGSRDSFDAASRSAEAARLAEQRAAELRRAAAATPRPAPTQLASSATATPGAPTTLAAPTAAPTLAPPATTLPATRAATPTPSLPAPAPTAAVDARIAEIEQVLDAYERAYTTLDLAALRSVMVLSPQQDKGLERAFKTLKSYGVSMSREPVQFEASGRARVTVSRQDSPNGNAQPPIKQTFVLERRGASWRIVDTTYDR